MCPWPCGCTEAGVTGNPSCGRWELNLGTLEKQGALISVEPCSSQCLLKDRAIQAMGTSGEQTTIIFLNGQNYRWLIFPPIA